MWCIRYSVSFVPKNEIPSGQYGLGVGGNHNCCINNSVWFQNHIWVIWSKIMHTCIVYLWFEYWLLIYVVCYAVRFCSKRNVKTWPQTCKTYRVIRIWRVPFKRIYSIYDMLSIYVILSLSFSWLMFIQNWD